MKVLRKVSAAVAVFNFCFLIKWFCAEALQQSVKLTGQHLQLSVCV